MYVLNWENYEHRMSEGAVAPLMHTSALVEGSIALLACEGEALPAPAQSHSLLPATKHQTHLFDHTG